MTYNVDLSKLKPYFGKVLKGVNIEAKFIKHYDRNNLSALLDNFLKRVEEHNAIINYDTLINFITDLEVSIHNGIYKDYIFSEIKNLTVTNLYIKNDRLVVTVNLEEW